MKQPKKYRTTSTLTPEVEQRIRELAARGLPQKRISEELKVSPASVHYTLHPEKRPVKRGRLVATEDMSDMDDGRGFFHVGNFGALYYRDTTAPGEARVSDCRVYSFKAGGH